MLLRRLEVVTKTLARRSERERAVRTDAREPTRVTRRRARVTAVYSNSRCKSGTLRRKYHDDMVKLRPLTLMNRHGMNCCVF